MATLGKPNIDTPRSLELRVVAQAIGNIRQRIEAIEAQTSTVVAQAGETTLRSGQQNISITALRTQLAALAARVDALAVVDAELETFRAGSAIAVNTAVYPSGDGLVSQVDPGDPLKVYAVLGVATQTAVEGANVVVRKAGVMQIADAVFEPGGPVYVGISGLTQYPDYINLAIPVGVAVSADEIDVRPGWPALQYPGVYSEYETFLPATWGLVRDAVTLADDFNSAANGIAVRTGEDDITTRTLTGTSNRVTVTNGSGVSGNPTIDISSSYVGQASITTVGTIGTGAWQGTVVAPAFGGTGVANNAASTITISGAFASTFTMTGVTAVTFPTSGTLATTAQLPVGANPSASVGLTAVNGSATTFMRSDGAPALSQAIAPTWTGQHLFAGSYTPSNTTTGVFVGTRSNQASMLMVDSTAPADQKYWEIMVSLSGGEWRLRGVNDAFNATRNAFTFNRSGAAITSITFGNATDATPVLMSADNQQLQIGASQDLRLYHDGTDSQIENNTGNLLIKSGGDLLLSEGQVALQTVGKGLSIKEGSNAKQGLTGNLVAGTLVVNNTSVTANSRIQLTRETPGGTLGHISYTKAAGTSFTITSTSATETSTFVYSIFEPS